MSKKFIAQFNTIKNRSIRDRNDEIVMIRNTHVFQKITTLLPKGAQILDCGAGAGTLSRKLYKFGYKVQACDLRPKDFRFDKITCEYADLNNRFPYANEGFDAVICLEVIEHLENPWHVLRECKRVLKKNGLVILSSPNISNVTSRIIFFIKGKIDLFLDMDTEHINPITFWEIKRVLTDVGFSLIEVDGDVDVIKNVGIVTHITNSFVKLCYVIFFTALQSFYKIYTNKRDVPEVLLNSLCYVIVAKKRN